MPQSAADDGADGLNLTENLNLNVIHVKKVLAYLRVSFHVEALKACVPFRCRSRSYSRSKSRSPSRKRQRTPPAPPKKHHKSSRDRRNKDDGGERRGAGKDKTYEKDYSKIADNYYKKKDKRTTTTKDPDYYYSDSVKDAYTYNDYYDARDYKPSSRKQQQLESRARSDSYSPSEQQQHVRNKKKYYKEKRRSRSRSRSPYERYEVKRAKSKKHANGHRRSRTPERYRR